MFAFIFLAASQTDWLLVLFTAFLVIVGFLQWWLVRRQDEHFRNSERAWILAELDLPERRLLVTDSTTKQGGLVAERTDVNVKLTCRNEGRSPAWTEGIYGRIDIFRKADSSVPKKTDLQRFGLIPPIGPGKERSTILGLSTKGHKTDSDFISVYVLIEYRDIFGIERQTTLSSVITGGEIHPQEALTVRNLNT